MTQVRKAGALLASCLIGMGALAACSGDFLSSSEQVNRLVTASAFGAVTSNIRAVQRSDYPGPGDRAAVLRWLTQIQAEADAAQQTFVAWTAASAQLTFVPADTPGPDKASIDAFDAAYLNWSSTHTAYTRAIRKCLRNKRPKVALACQENIQISSADARLSADTALSNEIANIQHSLSTVPTSAASSADASAS